MYRNGRTTQQLLVLGCGAVKLIFLSILLAPIMSAAWERLVVDARYGRVDAAEPHPLEYFTRYPALRDESGDFCYLCKPEKRLAEAKRVRARADVRSVGTIRGFTISEIFYYFDDSEKALWKSILVKVGPNSYREIYHDNPPEGEVARSFLVKAGAETLLGVEDNVYRSDAVEEYWWFGPEGPVRLDFRPVAKAAQASLPKGKSISWGGTFNGRTTLEKLVVRIGIRSEWNGRCCDNGVVTVNIKLSGGRVIVTGTHFDPKANYDLDPNARH